MIIWYFVVGRRIFLSRHSQDLVLIREELAAISPDEGIIQENPFICSIVPGGPALSLSPGVICTDEGEQSTP